MRKTESQKIALCGVLGALSVVLLLVGAALQIGTYAAPMLAAFLLIPVLDEYGPKYALLLYATVSVLSVLLVPELELAFFYVFVIGYYPVLRQQLARIKSTLLRWVIKFAVFNGATVLVYLLLFALLGPAILDELLADGVGMLAALLAASGRPADALEPKFTCKKCQDTGVVDGRTCSCVHKVMQALRRKEIEGLSSLSISSFDTMKLEYYPSVADPEVGESIRTYMAEVLADLRDYAADFSPATRESLLLLGNAGLGKTHAALAIAGEVLRQNYDVIYVSCPDFFGKLEALHFGSDPNGEEEALFQTASNADLLILDDLGTEFNSSFFLTNLYSLLNNRLGAKLPTIVTTNVTDGALLEKLYTEKISSRLAGFVQIKFFGNDIRVQKANE